MNDIAAIKSRLKLSELIGKHIRLTKDGHEYKACCPFHAESTPSFTINDAKGFFHCFGCGEHGDVIDWLEHGQRMPKTDAIKYAASLAGLGEYTGKKPKAPKLPAAPSPADDSDESDEWQPIIPAPADAPVLFDGLRQTHPVYNPKRAKESTYQPTHIFPYLSPSAELLGYVIRYEIDGKKITPQITYCQNTTTGELRWCVRHFNAPRPLYGLDDLEARPTAPVILVEGEKARDAGRAVFPKAVWVTWPGGTKGLAKVDWSPLQGRNVMMWPDADYPGQQAAWGYMQRGQLRPGIQQYVGTACRLTIIDPPTDAPKGWDVADAVSEGWDSTKIAQFLTTAAKAAAARGVIAPLPDPIDTAPAIAAPDTPQPDDMPPPPDADLEPYYGEPDYDANLREPFTALGHYRGKFFYLPNRSKEVLELRANDHRELNMMQLATQQHWENRFPGGGNSKVDWKTAADYCMQQCYAKGFFDPKTRMRGRGAWLDQGRAVLHLGETIIVNGTAMQPHVINSRYTYQADHSIEVNKAPALKTKEAIKLLDLCKKLSWENPRSALLLAGWCVVAPVCGILPWRPHIWVTGSASSGKTTVLQHIITPVVGPIALQVASATSESGIRQELGSDARPVIFDEAESEDKAQAQRIQAVLDLCRAASAESGAKIIKGTAGHESKSFQIRSCFAFSSINTALKHYADETRVTLLVLQSTRDENDTLEQSKEKERYFSELKLQIVETLNPDFSAGLLQRTLENLTTLRANIDTFATAASVILGSRRAADQLAPMLAGAYMLHSTNKITLEAAQHWIEENDLRESTPLAHAQDDETRLFQYLMGVRLRVQTTSAMADRTVGELIETVYKGDETLHGVFPGVAEAELIRFGVRVDKGGGFWISTNSPEIRRALTDTPWQANWARPLRMVKGASAEKHPIRFAPGTRSRAVYIPISTVVEP